MVNIAYVDVSSVDDALYERLYNMADAQRKDRANRYLRFEDKVRCAAAGALLRYAVRDSLAIAAFEVDTACNGKPYIKGVPSFHFNLSHSGKWVVIAYGDSPVGIDVEKIDPCTSIDSIATRFFTSEERAYVMGKPADQIHRFFEIWTAKESYIKFLGKGLQMALNSFSVYSIEGIRFFPIGLDPEYCLTLCAAEPVYSMVRLTPEFLAEA